MSNKINPAVWAEPVVSSDTANQNYRFLYIGVAGDVVVDLPSSPNITFANVPAGFFPIEVVRVRTATTATDIVGCR